MSHWCRWNPAGEMRQEKCSLLACLSTPPHPSQGWETEPLLPRPDSLTPKGGDPHPWLRKQNLQRESPPKKKHSKTHGTARSVVKDLGWRECPARVSPWAETRRNSPSLPEILLPCPKEGEGLVRVREGRGRAPWGWRGAAGKAGPRGSPLPSRSQPAALRSPGDPGRVSRSRDQTHPGGIPVAAFCLPSAFADYSSRPASLNYSSRHTRRPYPCRTTLSNTPRACPGPVALCPSPACRSDYTAHDPSRGAASGGRRRRRAGHAGSCSPRSGGRCNGPAGGTAPPYPPHSRLAAAGAAGRGGGGGAGEGDLLDRHRGRRRPSSRR